MLCLRLRAANIMSRISFRHRILLSAGSWISFCLKSSAPSTVRALPCSLHPRAFSTLALPARSGDSQRVPAVSVAQCEQRGAANQVRTSLCRADRALTLLAPACSRQARKRIDVSSPRRLGTCSFALPMIVFHHRCSGSCSQPVLVGQPVVAPGVAGGGAAGAAGVGVAGVLPIGAKRTKSERKATPKMMGYP